MKKFLFILILITTNAFAYPITAPPTLREEPREEQDYLNQVYNALRERSVILAFASSGGVSVGASTTSYAAFFGGAFGTTNFNSTSGRRQHIIPFDGIATNLYIRTTSTQPADGSLVFTVRKNSIDTDITVTISANGDADTYSDKTNQVQFSAGDLIDLKAVNNSASSSATVNQWSMEYRRN